LIPFITVAIHGPKESPVERAAAMGVSLPRSFDEWFFRTTAFKPDARFGLASEAVVALEKVFEHVSLADLMVTSPVVRPPAASFPALASTPGTFVPTAFPGNVEPAIPDRPAPSHSPEPRSARRTPLIVGGVALGVLGLSLVAWSASRTSEPAPASVSPALPLVSAHQETATPTPVPTPEPSPEPVVAPTVPLSVNVPPSPPQTTTRPDDKPKKDKPLPTSVVTAVPAPSPTTKKPRKQEEFVQD
jgi:hypothetical protein